MYENCIIGIDPGNEGSLFAIDKENRTCVDFYDITKNGREINITGIVEFLRKFNPLTCYVISEHPHPTGNKGEVRGVSNAFSFGKAIGIIWGIVITLGFRLELVTPPDWKKHHNLLFPDKDYAYKKRASVERAVQLSPQNDKNFYHYHLGKKYIKHDRAEAFLIAMYGAVKR